MFTFNLYIKNSVVNIVNHPASGPGPEPPARKNWLITAIRRIVRWAGIVLLLIGGCGG